jgi:hypothetical protein
MGRRFQEQFINKHKPQVSGGVRSVQIRPEHMTEVLCACGWKHFDRVMNIYRTPAVLSSGRVAEEGLSMVEAMVCRDCGECLPNERTPAFLKEYGKLERCPLCCTGDGNFEVGFSIQRVSRIATGSSEDQVMLSPAYFCRVCGYQYGGENKPKESRQDAAPTSEGEAPKLDSVKEDDEAPDGLEGETW